MSRHIGTNAQRWRRSQLLRRAAGCVQSRRLCIPWRNHILAGDHSGRHEFVKLKKTGTSTTHAVSLLSQQRNVKEKSACTIYLRITLKHGRQWIRSGAYDKHRRT